MLNNESKFLFSLSLIKIEKLLKYQPSDDFDLIAHKKLYFSNNYVKNTYYKMIISFEMKVYCNLSITLARDEFSFKSSVEVL